MEGHFFRQDLYISESLFISVTHLSGRFLRIVKSPSIHMLQLDFVNVFIRSIRLICFTTLKNMRLGRYVYGVVDLKRYLKWAANESYFFVFEKT